MPVRSNFKQGLFLFAQLGFYSSGYQSRQYMWLNDLFPEGSTIYSKVLCQVSPYLVVAIRTGPGPLFRPKSCGPCALAPVLLYFTRVRFNHRYIFHPATKK
jgi:hypothetical protein